MIKLTIYLDITNPEEEKPIQYVFNQQVITIGANGYLGTVDIALPDKSLQAEHVKIMEKNGSFIVLNHANDPFVTLNGHPFWKRNLESGDRLRIANTEILIECSSVVPKESSKIRLPSEGDISDLGQDANFMHSLQRKITLKAASATSKKYLEALNLPTEPYVEKNPNAQSGMMDAEERAFWDKEQESMDIDVLINQVERLNPSHPKSYGCNHKIELSSPDANQELEEKKAQDVFHVQFDPNPRDLKKWEVKKQKKEAKTSKESNHDKNEPNIPPKQDIGDGWKKYLIIISAALVLLIAIAVLLYFSFSDQRDEEEMKAAHSVADIAMAVTSAQLQHHKPLNENWYDPDFLKDNIKSILSSKYATLCQVDNQGKFSNCPYIFRIYTSNDLSRFVLIAQPVPSVLQWLIPKAAILVDSQKMELRKLTDITSLNHLIIDTNPLEGEHLTDIQELINKGELITLSDLAKKTHSPEFATPAELAFLSPGAENLIYNAPRYYKFSEPVMQAALKVGSGVEHDHTLNMLWHELDKRTVLHDMVFYTSQGIEASMQAQKILTASQIHHDFYVGYLTFNPKNGHIVTSHLVIAGEELKKNEQNYEHLFPHEIAMAFVNISSSDVDQDNPLFGKLRNLAMARQKALEVKSDEIKDLLYQESQRASSGFQEQFQKTVKEYDALSEEQKISIQSILLQLFQEQEEKGEKMSVPLFLEYINAARLDFYVDESLKSRLESEEKVQDHDID